MGYGSTFRQYLGVGVDKLIAPGFTIKADQHLFFHYLRSRKKHKEIPSRNEKDWVGENNWSLKKDSF